VTLSLNGPRHVCPRNKRCLAPESGTYVSIRSAEKENGVENSNTALDLSVHVAYCYFQCLDAAPFESYLSPNVFHHFLKQDEEQEE